MQTSQSLQLRRGRHVKRGSTGVTRSRGGVSSHLFDARLHVRIGGLCGGGGAVVVVSQVVFELVSPSLRCRLLVFLLLLPLGLGFAP